MLPRYDTLVRIVKALDLPIAACWRAQAKRGHRRRWQPLSGCLVAMGCTWESLDLARALLREVNAT